MTLLTLMPPPAEPALLHDHPVVIIGAGPVGLAAAAHLVEREIDFLVLETGQSVGASVRDWGHVRLFSPWLHLVDPASRRLLDASGWVHPDDTELPTGSELVEQYLEPLAALEPIASRIRTGVQVIAVSRLGLDRTRSAQRSTTPFVVRVSDHGTESDITARAVIDASGTYTSANSLAANGLAPLGLAAVADRVSPALPDVLGRDRERFVGRHTTVVGAGHSAVHALLALATLAEQVPDTRATWLIRTASATRISSSPGDDLAARASLGSRVNKLVASGAISLLDRFEIVELARAGDTVRVIGRRNGELVEHDTDLLVNATGFRPDLDMVRELRLDLDDIVEAPVRLAPMIDPNLHSCGTVEPHGVAELRHPEAGFFLAGMKSYGRAPTFLLATGYEQVRSITAWIAGDREAASTVHLTLPSTGVCSSAAVTAESSCC